MPRRKPSNADDAARPKVATSTVVKAMRVLEAVAGICEGHPIGASVTEIARRTGESPSSVCKHLAAFQQFGLIDQDPASERYRIGLYSLRLSTLALARLSIRDIAAPYLRRISDMLGETVHLVVRDELRVVYIDKVESPKTIRMHSEIGLRNPMYCTGVGKAILAFSPPALVDAVVAEGMTAYTPNTRATRAALLDDLAGVRARGYAIDDSEHEAEVRCVAAPIRNHRSEPVASLSVSCPKWRLPDDRIPAIGAMLKEIAAEISRRLGHADGT